MRNTIRISCSGLSSIKIGDRYLLIQNRKARKYGKIIYVPVGGGLMYNNETYDFLKSLKFRKERKENDLRIHIPPNRVKEFHNWFVSQSGREISNFRETYEELVLEEKVLSDLSIEEYDEELINRIRFKKKSPFHPTPSIYYFEIFKVNLPLDLEIVLEHMCNNNNSSVKLFTEEEIINKKKGKLKISNHSKYILR